MSSRGIGKEFSIPFKKRLREKVGRRCQGCGREIPYSKTAEVHHEVPVAMEGDRHTYPWVLDHECHAVADRLVLRYGVRFSQTRRNIGFRPFEEYRDDLENGRIGEVTEKVLRRMRSA